LDFGPLEDFKVKDGPKSGDLLKHHVNSYLDAFSSRQLLYLHQAIQQLQHYSAVTKLNLGVLVSASLEFNSMLCGYKGWYKRRPGAIRHVFALHAYSFPYTSLENNPINPRKSSGNLPLLFRDRIERGRKWAALPIERRIGPNGKSELVKIPGEVDGGVEVFSQAELTGDRQKFWLIHGDSRNLPINNHSVDLIVTDPPYYDSVQYSDLATFFRVWLAHLLPDEVEWIYDETHSAVATKATNGSSSFMTVLAGIFAECGRVLKRQTGRMVCRVLGTPYLGSHPRFEINQARLYFGFCS
jgi:putative DNA methylase